MLSCLITIPLTITWIKLLCRDYLAILAKEQDRAGLGTHYEFASSSLVAGSGYFRFLPRFFGGPVWMDLVLQWNLR